MTCVALVHGELQELLVQGELLEWRTVACEMGSGWKNHGELSQVREAAHCRRGRSRKLQDELTINLTTHLPALLVRGDRAGEEVEMVEGLF